MSSGENSIYECEPILKNQAFLKDIKTDKNISTVNYTAYKPVLFQSEKKERTIATNNKDTSYVQQEIIGAVLKGVDKNYDLSFFKKNLKKGRLPNFNKKDPVNELIISQQIANDLNLQLNDEVRAFFVKNQPVKRIFKLVGIYRTGLEEFDKKIAIGDIRIVQELNDWGVKASIEVADTLSRGQLIIRANVQGGNGNYRYDWGKGYEAYAGFTICPTKDTTIQLVVSDYYSDISGKNEKTCVPDTARLSIKVQGKKIALCNFTLNNEGILIRSFQSLDGNQFVIDGGEKKLMFTQINGRGSSINYVGGYELTVNDWGELNKTTKNLKKRLELFPNEHNETITVQSIEESQSDIFVWLGFLDINVFIILTLMIIIGIINMGSALLVMILVKSNFIGLMKAMGATNWKIRKVFLYQAGFLILRGMIIGNIVGLALCFGQNYFGVFRLNPEIYYIEKVPIELNFFSILILNIGTLIVCLSALIIPSIVISRVNPVKAIKFN